MQPSDRGTRSAPGIGAPGGRLIARAERAYAAAASLVAVALNVAFLTGSGRLWRDEINSLNLSLVGSWPEVWRYLSDDSFPVGWFVLLRPLASSLGPNADVAYRVAGVAVGLALFALVIAASWNMTGRVPLVTLGLLLTNAIVVRYGDSLRAYGIGMLLAAAIYWAFFCYAKRPSLRGFVVALLVSVAGVQFLYFNAIVVFAACCATALSCLLARAWKALAGAFAIGALAAATLIPYALTIAKRGAWADTLRYDIDAEWLYRMLGWSVSHSGWSALALWRLGFVFASIVAGYALVRAVTGKEQNRERLFHSVMLAAGAIGHLLFLLALDYFTAPWYFLTFLVVAAMAIDAIWSSVARGRARVVVVALLCAHLLLSAIPAARYVALPATNLDSIADSLARISKPGDLVLVTPWQCGLSWRRYYSGRAEWSTVPAVEFLAWQRYELFYARLGASDGADRLLSRVEATVAAGGRVFVVSPFERTAPAGPLPRPVVAGMDVAERRLADYLKSERFEVTQLDIDPEAIAYERCAVTQVRAARPRPGAK